MINYLGELKAHYGIGDYLGSYAGQGSGELKCRVSNIDVDKPFQSLSLGLLLIYLLATEVRFNNAEFLYISNPLTRALGFYVSLGFYPTPDIVGSQSRVINNAVEGEVDRDFLDTKLSQARCYSSWRGNVHTLNAMLHNKVISRFKFYGDSSRGACTIL